MSRERFSRASDGKVGVVILTVAALIALSSAAGAQVDNLEFVGHDESNPFHLMHSEIVGDKVYVSEGLGSMGMETYDISDPSAPIRVDQDGPTTWRTRAYPELSWLFGFSHADGVQLYEIGPTTTLSREYDPPDAFTWYEGGSLREGVMEDLLYVAAHQQGVEVLDVTDPGPITFVDSIDLGDNAAWDTEVFGQYLLVANGRFGLSVVDLDSVPPEEVTELPFLGLANDILVDGDVAYMSLGPGGLVSIDVSDPLNPVVLDLNTETSGNVTEIDIRGDLLVAGAWVRLETYDISDPSSIELVGFDDTKTWAMGASITDELETPMIAVADWRGVSTYRPNADPGADIEISTPRIDFGEVAVSADTVVYVYNRGSSTLDVTDVIEPADFLVSPKVFSLPSGGVQAVTVTATGPGLVRSSVRFQSNDPDEASLRLYVYKNNTFPQVGSPAPDYVLWGSDEQSHTLSDEIGKVLFLEFGANW